MKKKMNLVIKMVPIVTLITVGYKYLERHPDICEKIMMLPLKNKVLAYEYSMIDEID